MRGQLRGLSVIVASVVSALTLTGIPAGAATQTLAVALKTPTINVGQTAHISGLVSPAAPGATVRLQRFYARAWHPYQAQRLSGASTYDFAVAPGGAGVYRYRAASTGGVSRSVTLSVYGWLDLTGLSRQIHLGNGAGCALSATINGSFFQHTCTFQELYAILKKSSVSWSGLLRKCSTFEGTVGLVDSDKDVARANVAVSVDGVLLYSQTFSKGQSKNLRLNISGRRSIKVTTLAKNPADDWPLELVGLGNPRIRCTWHP